MMVECPRIVHRSKVRYRVRSAQSEFVQIQLAKNDGAGVLQPAHHLGILTGNPILEQLAGARGPDTRGVDVVL